MKALVKSALVRVHLGKPADYVYRGLRLAWRAVLRTDRRLASRYLAETREPRLHIGCAGHLLDGWLNSDLHPRARNILRLDATRRFPFPDSAFVHAYSEHVIEHLSFSQAASMLDECFRVLSPGGKVRITTPDLSFWSTCIRAPPPPKDEDEPPDARKKRSVLQERYVEWASAAADLPGTESGFVINHFMRGWGHRFIHDEPILRGLLEKSGFTGVARVGLNESDETALRNLANEGRMPDGFLRLESFTLEAGKPRGRSAGPSGDPATPG